MASLVFWSGNSLPQWGRVGVRVQKRKIMLVRSIKDKKY